MRHRRHNIVLALIAFAALTDCGGRPSSAPSPSTRGPTATPPPRATTLDSVFVLESSGSQPDDTTFAIAGGRTRTVVIRRDPPDNGLFARLTFQTVPGDSTRISIRPRPGLYGFDLAADRSLAAGVAVALSYAVNFVAPAGARSRYGNDLEFERALFLARADSGRVAFLPSLRPGSDIIESIIPGPGRYLLAAPRW